MHKCQCNIIRNKKDQDVITPPKLLLTLEQWHLWKWVRFNTQQSTQNSYLSMFSDRSKQLKEIVRVMYSMEQEINTERNLKKTKSKITEIRNRVSQRETLQKFINKMNKVGGQTIWREGRGTKLSSNDKDLIIRKYGGIPRYRGHPE